MARLLAQGHTAAQRQSWDPNALRLTRSCQKLLELLSGQTLWKSWEQPHQG